MTQSTQIEQLLSRLAAAPGRFAAALSRLEDADSVTAAQPGEWSPLEVLAHVRAAQDILEPRIYFIMVRDNPPLVAYDDVRWLEVTRYASLPIIDLLETMRRQRKELVHALRGISPDDWERTGTHEIRGSMTLLEIARHIAEHDEEHIAQIEELRGGNNLC